MKKVATIIIIAIAALMIAGVTGCSPKIIEHVRTEYVYKDREVRDSLYFRDSIYVKEKVRGDTVWLEKYVDRWRYKVKEVHDTAYVAVCDTTTVIKEVEKSLTVSQRIKQDSWWWLVAILVCLLVYIFRKPQLAFIRRFS